MITVHPEFIIPDGLWRASKNRHIIFAKSLAKLQEKLGCGYAIQDYFPQGYHDRPAWPMELSGKKHMPPSLKPKQYSPKKEKSDDILDLWGEGKTAPEIRELIHCSPGMIQNVLAKARKAGDPRAMSRVGHCYDDSLLDRMRSLRNKGFSNSQIAAEVGVSKGAVSGKLFRVKCQTVA